MADKIDQLKIGDTSYDIDLPPDATPSIASLTASGTIQGATIKKTNGTSSQFLKADGSVDSTTYLSSHQSIKTLKTDNTTAQSTSSSEAIAGSGTINLHKVAKTGTYSDLIGKPTIPATNVIPATTTANKMLVSTTTSGTAKWSDWSSAGFLKTNASGVISIDTNTYLTTSGTAANSSKLNNQEASYYLNYNNLSNKPTLPTFNSLNYISKITSGNTSTYKWHRLMHINTMAGYADCESTFYYTARFQNGYHCIFRVEFRTNNTSGPSSPSIKILSGNMPASDMAICMNYTQRSSDNVYEAYCDVFVKVGQWARAQLYRIGDTTSDRIVFYDSSEADNAASHIEAYTEINGSTAGCASYDLYQKSAYDNTGSTTTQSYPASDVSSWAKASTKPSYTASEVGALASNGTAVNSSKLNNQEASYYLNYNNLSNKPTIPSVSNATITVKQTGISDQTFTLNGSATTITLADTNTWRPVGTGATDAAAGNHAHGNITNTGTITSTAVTSATGFLVYDSNNKIQRATSANARTILGAGTYSKPSGGIPASDLAETYYLASNPNNYTSVTESTVSGWGFTKNAGTVTSVGAGTGLSISGTASVNPTVNIASGYKLPTTTEWSGKANDSDVVHKGTSSTGVSETIYGAKSFAEGVTILDGTKYAIYSTSTIAIGTSGSSPSTILTLPNTTGTLALTSQLPTASYSSGLQISTGRNLYVPYAGSDSLGAIKVYGGRSTAITATTGGTTSNRYYGVELDANGKAFVNVPWSSAWNPDWGYTLDSYQGATFGDCYLIDCPGSYCFGCGDSGFFIDAKSIYDGAEEADNMVLVSKTEGYAIFNLAHIQGIGIWNSDEGQSYDEYDAIDFKDIAKKGQGVAYGVCPTSGGTQVKAITVEGLKVRDGEWFVLELTNENSYSSSALYLNINSSGNRKIWINDLETSSSRYAMPSGQYLVQIDGNNCYCYPLHLKDTRLVSSLSSSSTIGTQYYNFDKIVTIYGTESSQNGTIKIQFNSTSGTTMAQATGEQGYWGKQDLCVTAHIPAGQNPYIYLNKMGTVYYRLTLVV